MRAALKMFLVRLGCIGVLKESIVSRLLKIFNLIHV